MHMLVGLDWMVWHGRGRCHGLMGGLHSSSSLSPAYASSAASASSSSPETREERMSSSRGWDEEHILHALRLRAGVGYGYPLPARQRRRTRHRRVGWPGVVAITLMA